jgi:hypothetical protein
MDGVGTDRYTYASGGFANNVVTNFYTNRLRIVLSLAQPTGFWTNGFGYDDAKRLTNVTSPAGAFNYTYDPTRQREVDSLSLPSSCVITNDYDPVAFAGNLPWWPGWDGSRGLRSKYIFKRNSESSKW